MLLFHIPSGRDLGGHDGFRKFDAGPWAGIGMRLRFIHEDRFWPNPAVSYTTANEPKRSFAHCSAQESTQFQHCEQKFKLAGA